MLSKCCASETVRHCFRGSKELPYHNLCLSAEKNSMRGKVIDKKWFIRIGCLWGLQAGRREMPHPRNLLGYSFIIKGKVGRGRRTSLPFLSRCHASITSSSSTLDKGVFLCLHGRVHKLLFSSVCAESMSQGSLNYWAHCPGCGSHATIVLLFGGISHASVAWFCC